MRLGVRLVLKVGLALEEAQSRRDLGRPPCDLGPRRLAQLVYVASEDEVALAEGWVERRGRDRRVLLGGGGEKGAEDLVVGPHDGGMLLLVVVVLLWLW